MIKSDIDLAKQKLTDTIEQYNLKVKKSKRIKLSEDETKIYSKMMCRFARELMIYTENRRNEPVETEYPATLSNY